MALNQSQPYLVSPAIVKLQSQYLPFENYPSVSTTLPEPRYLYIERCAGVSKCAAEILVSRAENEREEKRREKEYIRRRDPKMNSYQQLGEKRRPETQYGITEISQTDLRQGGDRKSHVRRYWVFYAAGAVVGLAVTLLIVFFAIIPAVVQGIVSGSQLPVYSASLLNPTQNSVDFSLNSSIETPGAITAVLKPLNLSLTGQTVKTPFVTLNLPQTNLRGKSFITVTNQTTKILDMPSFMSFLGSAVSGANFSMQVTGKTDTFIGAIRAPISLDKTLQMVGFSNISDFSLADPQLVSPPRADGTNLLGIAVVPNPSVITLQLGVLGLTLQVENFTIGNATIDNMFLVPGANNLPLRATVDLTVITSNLAAIAAAQPSFTSNGTLAIKALSRTVTFNGQRLPFYEQALAPVVLTSFVNVQKLLAGGQSTNASTKATAPLAARMLADKLAARIRPWAIERKMNPWV